MTFWDGDERGGISDEEIWHFKKVVKSVMYDASKVLAELELEVDGAEAERLMSLLDQYLSYAQKLCAGKLKGVGNRQLLVLSAVRLIILPYVLTS